MDGEPASLESFERVVQINLLGTFNLARLVAARIVKAYPKPKKRVDLLRNLKPDDNVPDEVPGAVTEDRACLIFASSVAYEEGGSFASSCGRSTQSTL
jgi:NAD(P)-dependent dehydrogenase (short-subunit alcohol dehydrogenase family)